MKHLSVRLFLVAVLAASISHFASAQTLVNQSWQDTIGHPLTTLPYQAAITDHSGNVYIGGSTYTTGAGVATLLVKYSSSGTLLWSVTSTDSVNAAYITVDIHLWGNDVYLTGMKYDSATSKSSIFLFKYNGSTGAFIWNKSYSGSAYGYDVAAAVTIDPSGNVYIAGTDQKSATESQMVVIRYDSLGNQTWVGNYDTASMFTGGSAITVQPGASQQRVIVTGFSGTGLGSWSFVTAHFALATGALQAAPTWASNGNGNFSSPAGVEQDDTGRTYIAGTATHSGSNTDIKVIAYDTSFNERWLKIWGNADSLADSASRMIIDKKNNILVTGYTTASKGIKQMLVLKYTTNGTLAWSRTIGGSDSTFNCTGTDITVDTGLNVYVTGKVYNGYNYDFITIAFDKNGNTLWEETYDGGGTNDIASDVVLDSLGNVYVTGTSSTTTHSTYVTLQYTPKKYTFTTVNDTSGKALYVKDNVIVRFAPSVLDTALINNGGIVYGALSQFLKSTYYSTVVTDFEKDYPDVNITTAYLVKLAPHYRTTSSYLISKIGDTILIPPFWSSFLMVFTSSTTTEQQVANELKSTAPNVKYAHLNYTGQPATCTNGGGCDSITPTDTYYCSEQFALHDNSGGNYTRGNMNTETAWALQTGQTFVKAGVFDGDVWYTHPDFLTDSVAGVSKVNGADYTNPGMSTPLYSITSFDAHGTMVAGFLGALRNNNKGIAGIAGGNWCSGGNSTSSGVSLYSLGIIQPNGSGGVIPMSNVVQAMNDALDNDSTVTDANLDIFNFSDVIPAPDTNFNEYREKFYFAFRLEKIVVAARGNTSHLISGNYTEYPACFNDDWILSVGGSNSSGDCDAGNSLYGSNMDVVAPDSSSMNYGLSANGLLYASWTGTSCSAPYVSGLAGLILSDLNNPNSHADSHNMAPEDVEYITQSTAYFDSATYSDPPYDTMIGWGRVDMGKAMQMVDKTHNRIIHYTSLDDTVTMSGVLTTVDSNINLTLLEDVPNLSDSFIAAGNYKADVIKVTETVHYNPTLRHGETIKANWARSSASDSYNLFTTVGGVNQLEPYEKDTIQPISGTSNDSVVTLWGYYYKIKNFTTDSFINWIPQSPSRSGGEKLLYPRMSFTVYINSDTVIPTGIKTVDGDFEVAAFPNPAENRFHLSVQSSQAALYTVTLLNDLGQSVKTLFTGQTDRISADFSVNEYEAGMYYLRVSSAQQNKVIKIVITK